LPAVDFADCLLGVWENAGAENDAEIAAVKNAIETISVKLFISIPPSFTIFLYPGQPKAATGGPQKATNPSPRPRPPHFRRVRPAICSHLGAEMGRIGNNGR
jgi:hypothetical protein